MKKLVTFVVVLVVFLLIWKFGGSSYGEKLEFNSTDIYYTELVTEADAQKLGEYLLESEFADGRDKSVQLSRRDSVYLFRMVVMEGVEKDSSNDITFEAMALTLSWNVFDNAPVELEACDDRFNTLRVYGKR
mgnify:FL=1